jgi:dihydrofolate reductase
VPNVIFLTATSLDGYLADSNGSLDWLFAVEGGDDAFAEFHSFVESVTVIVEGSTTYEWVIEHEQLLEHPEKWQEFYGKKKTYVFTTRAAELPRVPNADVEFICGPVSEHISSIIVAAGDGNVWVVGGGTIAAQFAAIDRLDEIWLSFAPVLLGDGAPLFTTRINSEKLRLLGVHQTGQFVQARYALDRLSVGEEMKAASAT